MKKIIFPFLFLALTHCASVEKAGRVTDIGIWQGKVLIQNEKTKHKNWANVTWASDSENEKMRVDVYAIMDIPLATFLKSGTEYHLWLFTEKKYFHSLDGEKLFQHLTKMKLNPSVFYSLLGRPMKPGRDWKCNDNNNEFQCSNSQKKTSLLVQHENQDQRIIKILNQDKSLRLRLNRSKVQVSDEAFQMLSTSHYKTIEI